MDSSNSKVSFIPKGPLVRDGSFLERKRPQSAIGFLAIIVFVASVSSYVGLYFYNASLFAEISTRTEAIEVAQAKFRVSPEVAQAKVFRARAELSKGLLAAHVTVSPIFTFLSDNTLESVMYEKFSFVRGDDGFTLELSGQAPTYAALAYQADKLRESPKKELTSFSIDNVTLNKFGSVNFSLKMVFSSEYLSYVAGRSTKESTRSIVPVVATSSPLVVGTSTAKTFPAPTVTSQAATSSVVVGTTTTPLVTETKVVPPPSSGWNTTEPSVSTTTKSSVTTNTAEGNWWSWFKFW